VVHSWWWDQYSSYVILWWWLISVTWGVNLQNDRYWSSHNLRLVYRVSLHDSKIGVGCEVSTDWIILPIFCENTVNSERYYIWNVRWTLPLLLPTWFCYWSYSKDIWGHFWRKCLGTILTSGLWPGHFHNFSCKTFICRDS
jgi:hypothetical protein